MFKGHLLPKKTVKPKLHFTDYDYGVAGVLLVAYILFVWIYSTNRKKINQIFKTFYFSSQSAREELFAGSRVSITLLVLFVLSAASFLFETIEYFGFNKGGDEILLLVKLIVAITFAYGLKIFGVRLFGNILQNQKPAKDYALIIVLFCNVFGLLLLPIVVCIAFVEGISPRVFIYAGGILYALLLFARIIRGIMISLNSAGVSILYLFLYLCALEILPLLIVIKLLMRFI
jgi:hypothetical protein